MIAHTRFAVALTAVSLALAPMSAGYAQTAKKAAASRPMALSPAASPESLGFDSARLARLDAYMAGTVANGRVAGMTTLLARHGKVVSFKTYGKASLETGAPMTEDISTMGTRAGQLPARCVGTRRSE